MNKLELIRALKDATNLSKSQSAAVVDIFFNGMTDALAKGDRVEIRDYALFSSKNTMDTPGAIPRPARR